MKIFLPLIAVLAGCASGPSPDRPHAVVVRLEEEAGQVELQRPILARLFGEERQSLGRMLEELVTEELVGQGQRVLPCPAEGSTPEELATVLREAGGADGIVWIRMGRWNLDGVASGGNVTVAHEVVLYRTADAAPGWAWRVPSRTMRLRAGEQRDIRAFLERLVVDGLRGYP
ncbi:MAG: hypothetical protein HYY18_06505 [Planctomycetes bacterium]|nr:hypothetical protein [Planctomycetota bacterium]